ncbi:hypothetical protein B0J13DRAFT_623711 [Dactylonectria estremocensis]|uniref:Uncharacterized protein n=1 Tax=Dactylonectria estremocensis TaxID=1079267 RepID=A0A9P9EQH2_9HYPO|nr:hypothetical protein B0J13DRAFT_623711 [Dactylonectria estremocensis]
MKLKMALGLALVMQISAEDVYEDLKHEVQSRPCFSLSDVPPNQEWFGCKPKHNVNKKGECEGDWAAYPSGCTSYCESYVEWRYGPEARFQQVRCARGPCKLEPGLGANITVPVWQPGISKFSFTTGSTFNYYDPSTTAVSAVVEKPRELFHECGYFTFIPYMVKSCGVTVYGRYFLEHWCKAHENRGDCRENVLQRPNGKPDGIIVFVATDCNDHFKLRPFCKQDPAYLKAGVSYNPLLRKEYLEAAYYNGDANKAMLKEAWQRCMALPLDRTVLYFEKDGKTPRPPPFSDFQ